jgi:hypothetical protein
MSKQKSSKKRSKPAEHELEPEEQSGHEESSWKSWIDSSSDLERWRGSWDLFREGKFAVLVKNCKSKGLSPETMMILPFGDIKVIVIQCSGDVTLSVLCFERLT